MSGREALGGEGGEGGVAPPVDTQSTLIFRTARMLLVAKKY